MNNEEEFKAKLRKLVESKEFSFEESDWEKASELLHPERSRRRIIYYMAAGLLLLVSGIASYFYFIDDVKPASTEVPTVTTTAASSAAEKNLQPASPENKPLSPTTIKHAAKLPEGPASQPKQLAGPSPAASASEKIIPRTEHTPVTKQKEIPVEKNNVVAPEKTIHNVTTASQPLVITPEKNSEASTPISEHPDATVSKKEEPAKNGEVQAVVKSEESPAVIVNSKEPEKQPEINNAKADIPAIESVVIPEVSQTIVSATETAVPSASQTAMPEAQPTVAAAPVQTTPAKADSAAMAQNTKTPEMPLHKKIVMNFEAGLDYLAGWRNSGATDANGFNPVVGFNYYNYLTDKLAVSFGAQYTSISHLSAYTHISKLTHYDLGVESSVTAITPQKIHYLAVPLKLNYLINDNNAIGIGCNIAYMLTIDSKMETYDEAFGRKSNDKVYKTSGYADGFAAFDTQLSVFYRRKIYRNLSASAEAVYGLTDIKTNGFFDSNTTERNIGLKLTLQYNLFK